MDDSLLIREYCNEGEGIFVWRFEEEEIGEDEGEVALLRLLKNQIAL